MNRATTFSRGEEVGVSIRKRDIVELEISDLAYGGTSVAKVNGYVVLIYGGIPGDVVKAEITKKKTNYAEAKLLELVKESPLRAKPSCSHFGFCGGCTWQNLKYEEQVRFKAKFVKDSLERIGGFTDPPVEDALGSDDVFYYRNKMEYAFSPHSGKKLVLGLHPRKRFDLVFDLKECFLQSKTANGILDFVRTFAREKNLSAYDHRTKSGLLRYLVVKEGKNTDSTMVNLVTYKGDFPPAREFSDALLSSFPFVKSVVRNINSKLAQIAVGEEEELLGGERTITEKLGEFTFEISSNSFFQTNPRQAEKLYEVVLDASGLQGDEEVLDLYCGNGTISMFLSRAAKKVIGVESLEEAVQNARRNAELNGVSNCEFIQGEAKAVLRDFEQNKAIPDLVVIDPPRAGLHPRVIKSLQNLKPQRIVYVSCNPTTLARDLTVFCRQDYKLENVKPVDMFPHTYHIESVAKLSRI
ncbi:MAG: 23S rRNA (uracil(1939)-C(5))-methyltransferase RlmD [Candidatus Zixiibacteriota bacterium]